MAGVALAFFHPRAVLPNCAVDTSEDDPAAVAAWNTLKQRAFAEIQVTEGWGTPELVPGAVNSIGWEDSAFISADGKTLSFFYLRGDLLHYNEMLNYHAPVKEGGLGGDPTLFRRYHRGPSRGVTPVYTADSFHATQTDGKFCNLTKFAYSKDGWNEWGLMQAANGDWYYVSHETAKKGFDPDLYRNGAPLPIPGRNGHKEDNPHFLITTYGQELFFDSLDDRGGLWVTRFANGRWSNPMALASPLDSKTNNQPFLTADGALYFTSAWNVATKSWEPVGIWKSQRLGENAWSQPSRVLWPTQTSGPRVWGVGEPTLTADGQWLYFVVVFVNERDQFDCDVGRVARK